MCSALEFEDGVIRGKRSSYSVQSPFWPDDLEKGFSSGTLPFFLAVAASDLAGGAESGLDFSSHTSALPDAFG